VVSVERAVGQAEITRQDLHSARSKEGLVPADDSVHRSRVGSESGHPKSSRPGTFVSAKLAALETDVRTVDPKTPTIRPRPVSGKQAVDQFRITALEVDAGSLLAGVGPGDRAARNGGATAAPSGVRRGSPRAFALVCCILRASNRATWATRVRRARGLARSTGLRRSRAIASSGVMAFGLKLGSANTIAGALPALLEFPEGAEASFRADDASTLRAGSASSPVSSHRREGVAACPAAAT
jgi:hypothetical protein